MAPNPVPAIPRTHQVIPGAHVNIVLKADQRTGRQVQGTVLHVLTRGDHHRGIKVRLTDGRIGRVQSMALSAGSDSSAPTTPSSSSVGNTDPSSSLISPPAGTGVSSNQGYRPRYRDVRLDEPLDVPPEQADLGAYIVPSRRKGRGKKKSNVNQAGEVNDPEDSPGTNGHAATQDVISATATCPVCGAFEGDETAVAHHVAEHFGS
ncbi:hypothetical protein F4777DRAFT_152937 [Nemania sp. FL0916]|nr:hypothetical protein F4777DRAFT_152937 [Nemania sp. FL0916]